ncbi:MAG TPA: anti-sigma factor [Myxococcota bacterium]|nr:anti-sigma factor [Myxococcota bacterium]
MSERDDAGITALIKRHYDPVATEPIPARMHLRAPAWIGRARAAAILAAGIGIGMALPWPRPGAPGAAAAQGVPLPVRAARAHAVYAAEVRHPVEVDASQQEHLVKWLSKRLDRALKVPVLSAAGFELLGGRLLPGPTGAVAQFMYQDPSGKRLTLYVSRPSRAEAVTAFRFAREGRVAVFYWIDRDFGYALSGELDKAALSRLATLVHRQLES